MSWVVKGCRDWSATSKPGITGLTWCAAGSDEVQEHAGVCGRVKQGVGEWWVVDRKCGGQ